MGGNEARYILHAVPADEGILEGVGEGMAAVKSTSNVGGRKRNDISVVRSLSCVAPRLEEATLLPPRVPGRFDRLGGVGLEVRMRLIIKRI